MSIKTANEIKALGDRVLVLEKALKELQGATDRSKRANAKNDRKRASSPR